MKSLEPASRMLSHIPLFRGSKSKPAAHRLLPHPGPRIGLSGLDYLFLCLTIAGLGAICALAYDFVTAPYLPGAIIQSFAIRILFGLVIGPIMLLVGWLLLRRLPGNVVGRFLILLALTLIGGQGRFALGTATRSELVLELFLLAAATITMSALVYLMFTFPDGRFFPLWLARWAPLYVLLKLVGAALEIMASAHRIKFIMLPVNPLFVPALAPYQPIIAMTIGITGLILPLGLAGGLLSLRARYRLSSLHEQQKIKWVIWAFGMLAGVMLLVVGILTQKGLTPEQVNLGLMLGASGQMIFLVALLAAIVRRRLFDINLIINRTLVYGGLTACVIAIYVVVVGVLATLFEAHGNLVVSLIATGLIAVIFQPLRERLQRAVNRLLYGERDDPYAVLSRLGQRLEATLAPEAVLPTIAETVAQTLKLPYAAVALKEGDDFEVVASYPGPGHEGQEEMSGNATGTVPAAASQVILPLLYQSEIVGQLRVARRGEGEAFTAAEERLLADIAHQAGVAVHAVRLTADLQRSRERLVTSREDERRRVRRNLHDGLGPALATMKLKLEALHYLLASDRADADAVVAELETDTQNALDDIRRLVYDLRPPALDQLGLVSAIAEYAAGLSSSSLEITVEGPRVLPSLPAAVEVAAYRIALEALTNIVRHAQARHCIVRISLHALQPSLLLEVSDDGVGLPAQLQAGVGLASMRERAAELGGVCTITSMPEGGTCVVARLPWSAEKGE